MEKNSFSCPNCGTNIKGKHGVGKCPMCDVRLIIDKKTGEISADSVIKNFGTPENNHKFYMLGIVLVAFSLAFFLQYFIRDFFMTRANLNASNSVVMLNFEPTSKAMVHFCESVFEKKIDEITQEEYDKIKYLMVDSFDDMKDFKMIYSFDHVEFKMVRFPAKDFEHEHIPLYDFQPFRKLETLNFEAGEQIVNLDMTEGNEGKYHLKSMIELKVLKGTQSLPIEKIPEMVIYPEKLTTLSGSFLDGTKIYESAKKLTGVKELNVLSVDMKATKYLKFISKFKQLESLHIVSQEDNEYLSAMTGLKKLHLTMCSNIYDLSFLSALSELESLNLESAVNVYDIDFLSGMERLESLSIDNSKIKNINVLRHKPLKSLTLISNNAVMDYSPISNLVTLERLYISANHESNYPKFPKLGRLKNLRNLTLSDFWVNYIETPPKLNNLTIITQLASDFYIDDISHLSRLKSLRLIGGGYVKNSHKFFEMKELRRLEFQNVRLMFMNLTHVFNHPNLYALSFIKIQSYTMNVDKIRENNSLKFLFFDSADTIYEIADYDDMHAKNPNLEDPEALRTYEKFKFYEIPIVGKNTVQKKFYTETSFLSKLKGIKVLTIKNANLDNIDFVASMNELEYLNLSKNHIKDVSVLKNLKELMTVILYDNPIEETKGFDFKVEIFK